MVSHVILKRGRVVPTSLPRQNLMARIWWLIVFGAACYGFGALSVTTDELFGIAQFYGTQRSLLLPHHRPERTLGLMGLRIHRSSSLPLPLTRLASQAPATRATLARTISERATSSSAQLSKELDQDPNPEHCTGSSRKHFMEACLNSSRMHDEAVLSKVSIVGKRTFDRVEIHQGETRTVSKTVVLVPMGFEDPPGFSFDLLLQPEDLHHIRPFQIFSERDGDRHATSLLQQCERLINDIVGRIEAPERC